MHHRNEHDSYNYVSGMSRRESLKWLGLLAAGSAVSLTTGCTKALDQTPTSNSAGHWPDLDIKPVTATGYGQDPNLVMPPESPWPLTLTADELTLVALLSDYIVPREGSIPSASELQVPAVINEWVSAPYEGQQRDRVKILNALAWINDEAQLRFKKAFVALDEQQHRAILDDIAYYNEQTPAQFQRVGKAFLRFKELVLAAFFCTPEGCKDIGYLGNVPIAGDYPGPSEAAQAHLDQVLSELGLTEYAYKD